MQSLTKAASNENAEKFEEPDDYDDDNDDDDDDGDYEDVQRPVLGFGDGVDLEGGSGASGSQQPCSAQEYLRSVMVEARRCPKVVVAKQPVPSPGQQQAKLKAAQPALVWPDSKCRGMQVSSVLSSANAASGSNAAGGGGIPATPDWAHSAEWQLEQVAAFAELRERLADCRLSARAAAPPPSLPKPADAPGWRRFCYGTTGGTAAGDWKTEEEEDEDSDEGESADEDGSVEDSGDGEKKKKDEAEPDAEVDGHLPLVSLVSRLPRSCLLALLSHHALWLTGPEPLPFTDRLGQWLFALLAVLRTPLTSEEADRLRRLARACRRERLRLPGGRRHPAAAPLSLIVCLVARYFGQADLADDVAADDVAADDVD